jgi:hypothetical protein
VPGFSGRTAGQVTGKRLPVWYAPGACGDEITQTGFSVKRDGVIVITDTAPQPREPDHILRQAIHRQYPLDTREEVTLTEWKPEVAVAAAQERMAAKMYSPALSGQADRNSNISADMLC